MSRDHLPPNSDDALLQRYHEANALDPARPDAALRENVLAHARTVATSRTGAARPQAGPAANDSVWTWRALGGLAMFGLAGLLVLQFDRGTPEEKEVALGTDSARSAAQTTVDDSSLRTPATAATGASQPLAEPSESAAARAQPPQTAVQPQKQASVAPAQRISRSQGPEALVPGAADRFASAETARAPEPAASAASIEVAPPPQAPAAPAPAAKAMAPQTPAPMLRSAPVAGAPAPATTDSAAPAGASHHSTEGIPKERRESTTTRTVPPPSPLFAAIASGDAQAVQQRLVEGADPNSPDATGRTPLIAAARSGNDAVVRRLLAAGADRAQRDREGLSAADHAERSGHLALLPLLR